MAYIKTEVPSTFSELLKILEKERKPLKGFQTLFRGQSDHIWPLLSTSARIIRENNIPFPLNDIAAINELLAYFNRFHPSKELLDLEKLLISKYNKHIDPTLELGKHIQQEKEKAKIEGLDSSTPLRTPFLDCSRNPFVALFFANTHLKSTVPKSSSFFLNRDTDGAVWILKIHYELIKANFYSVVEHIIYFLNLLAETGERRVFIPPFLFYPEAGLRDPSNPKPERQEAEYIVQPALAYSLEEIAQYWAYLNQDFIRIKKIILKKELSLECENFLNTKGYTINELLPGTLLVN